MTKSITLAVQNIKCNACEKSILNRLKKIAGVTEIIVNNNTGSVQFIYDNDATIVKVKNTLKKMGYPEMGSTNNFSDKAKSYVNCMIGKTKV